MGKLTQVACWMNCHIKGHHTRNPGTIGIIHVDLLTEDRCNLVTGNNCLALVATPEHPYLWEGPTQQCHPFFR